MVALFLDFDGTLAPIAPRPEQVSLDGPVRRLLSALARSPRFRVWIISGRRREDIRARVGVPRIRYLGLHGWERQGVELPEETNRCLRALWSRSSACLGHIPGIWIEDKQYAFAVHYRGAAAQDVARAHAILDGITVPSAHQFRLEGGKGVWEILPYELENKGAAVRRELQDLPASALPMYLGDDQTDEPAFRVLHSGITVHVGSNTSRALYRLTSVAQVRMFLQHLKDEMT